MRATPKHPPLTWDQVLGWAAANEIAGGLPVSSMEGELLRAVRADRGDLLLEFGAALDQAFTWGRLKAAGAELAVSGHARLIFDDAERGLHRVVDLGESLLAVRGPGHDEIPVFVFQHRWG